MAQLSENAEKMSATLEINLTSDETGVRLSFTQFKNDANGVKRNLVVSGEQHRAGFEPDQTERLRSYGDPQRAILILLLRAFDSKFKRDTLTSEYSPQLARSLFGIMRKQIKKQTGKIWLSHLVGLQPHEHLAEWFIGEGSATLGRSCYVRLAPKWKSVTLVVKVNGSPTPVPVADYEKLARVIEFGGRFTEPKATVTIDDFKLLVWNGALACFARECDKVRHGDRVQLQLRTNQPTHLYVLWLDQLGHVVTLYPWRKPNWDWPINDVMVESLTIPDPKRDDAGNALRVEGPAGVENIIILARSEPISRNEAQTFRGMIEDSKLPRQCPRPEVLVVSKFDGTPRPEKPTRNIRRLVASPDVKAFQAKLASDFTPHFQQVLICTFTNEGKDG
jgi:hypothetical protein